MKEVIMQVASFSADYPKAPIYVADLVRCKECKKSEASKLWAETSTCVLGEIPSLRCKAFGLERDPDDFCSYGEREGE